MVGSPRSTKLVCAICSAPSHCQIFCDVPGSSVTKPRHLCWSHYAVVTFDRFSLNFIRVYGVEEKQNAS